MKNLRIQGSKSDIDKILALINNELPIDSQEEFKEAIQLNNISVSPISLTIPKLGEREPLRQIELFYIVIGIASNIVSSGLYDLIKLAVQELSKKKKIKVDIEKE